MAQLDKTALYTFGGLLGLKFQHEANKARQHGDVHLEQKLRERAKAIKELLTQEPQSVETLFHSDGTTGVLGFSEKDEKEDFK